MYSDTEQERIKASLEALRVGDPISGIDLVLLIRFLTTTEQALLLLGPEHALSFRDVRSKLYACECFRDARQRA